MPRPIILVLADEGSISQMVVEELQRQEPDAQVVNMRRMKRRLAEETFGFEKDRTDENPPFWIFEGSAMTDPDVEAMIFRHEGSKRGRRMVVIRADGGSASRQRGTTPDFIVNPDNQAAFMGRIEGAINRATGRREE